MKNILKKLGVIGLAIAVLAPFIELPKVNAAETNCKKHLQNYMFLDANFFALDSNGKTFLEGYSSSTTAGGYLTYTVFPYAFVDNSSTTTKVNWIETNNFGGTTEEVSDLETYWTLAQTKDSSDKVYLEIDPTESNSYYASSTNAGSVFIIDSSHKNSTYTDNAVIFHGVWASYDSNGNIINQSTKVSYEYGEKYSLQKIFASKSDTLKLMSAEIDTATLKAQTSGLKLGSSTKDFNTNYFQSMIDNNWNNISESSAYIPLSITRTINYSSGVDSTLNNFIYGYVVENSDGTKAVKVFTKTGKTNINEIKDSYTALKEYLANPTGTASTHVVSNDSWTESVLDFNTGKAYYWPVVLTVEYESCTTTGQWAVEYDDNVDDTSVNNLPSTQKESLGTPIKVSSTKPSRSGYVFKGWCEKGNDKCSNPYESGDTITSPTTSQTITLLAQWAKEGTEDNKKTGVASYIIGFAAVGIVAGGIYLISKKKNLFKQI